MTNPNDRKSGCLFALAILGGIILLFVSMDLLGIGMAKFIPWVRQFWQ